jgi:hypothetical protein
MLRYLCQLGCYDPCSQCGAHFVAAAFKGKPVSLSTVHRIFVFLLYFRG